MSTSMMLNFGNVTLKVFKERGLCYIEVKTNVPDVPAEANRTIQFEIPGPNVLETSEIFHYMAEYIRRDIE